MVLAHMYSADQSSWASFAQRLAKEGYTALTFDFRGYGESPGSKEIAVISKDVSGAVDVLRGRGIERVYLVGASMGGTASLLVAQEKAVAGVVTLSAPVSFQGLDASQEVTSIVAPKLFIAATADGPAEASLQVLYQAAPEPKERVLIGGDAHGTDLLEVRDGLVATRILIFLKREPEE